MSAPQPSRPRKRAAPKKPERKIAVVGFTSSRNEAPYDDPSWEIWTVNNLPIYLAPEGKRITANFDPHDEATIRSDDPYVSWLRTADVPVFLDKHYEDFPTSLAFPRDELLAWCDERDFEPYFTNTISWLIALALMEGVTELACLGIDMAQTSEYGSQRPSVELWLGIARGLGVPVHIPDTSDLLKSAGLYGWGLSQQTDAMHAKLTARSEELGQQAAQVEAELQRLTCVHHQLAGARENNDYWRNVWFQPQGTRNGADPLAEGQEPQQPSE